MTEEDLDASAATLWQHWRQLRRLPRLPPRGRPATRAEGYAIQSRLVALAGQRVIGWKIAATSPAGQAHIHVDGPLAGQLLEQRVLTSGATVALDGNLMRVAEAEFAFRLGRDLGMRARPYSQDEVMATIDSMHLAIEIPDSRYEDYTVAGAPQLIADNACASWVVLGAEVATNWRDVDLSRHEVNGYRNDALAVSGSGANVLGDPRIAMSWMANELRGLGDGLRAGQIVTTGTCIVPIAVAPGDRVRMEFGVFGAVAAAFS